MKADVAAGAVAGVALATILGLTYAYQPRRVAMDLPTSPLIKGDLPRKKTALAAAATLATVAGAAHAHLQGKGRPVPANGTKALIISFPSSEFIRYRTYGDGHCMFVCLFILTHYKNTGEWIDPSRRTTRTVEGAQRMRQLAVKGLARMLNENASLQEQIPAVYFVDIPTYMQNMAGNMYGDIFALVGWQKATGVGVQAYEKIRSTYVKVDSLLYPTAQICILSTDPQNAGHFDVIVPKPPVRTKLEYYSAAV